jgi:beta-lactamase regulating signal transducer with metallopeptidase domain
MFALVFLQASLASLLAGACAWLLLRLAARAWPALEARRTPWLLALAVIAATLGLGLLPASARLSLVPAIELPGVAATRQSAAGGCGPKALPAAARTGCASQAAGAEFGDGSDAAGDFLDDNGASPAGPAPALRWLGYAWLAIYTGGLAAACVRWLHARRRLQALLASARRLDRFELAAHPGFASLQRALPEVREIDAPIAPMLVGLARPVLLLPRHLRDFDPAQQRLVVAHELTHLARPDPLWIHACCLLQAVQWFNPAAKRLGGHLAWAQELGCDHAVLQGRPASQRRAYAAALVAQMRMQAAPGHGMALAFGGRAVDAVAARIAMVRDGVPTMPRAAAALAWAALPVLLAASVLLQPALAWRLDAAPASAGSVSSVTAPPAANSATGRSTPSDAAPDTSADGAAPWQAPMERLRVSAFYGIVHGPTGRPHGGMDFAARTGTPVVAPADGIVIASTKRYRNEDKWGELIAIDHGNGLQSLYAHLDRRLVKEGERVAAGQQIGTAGATGKATGPHLHMEVHRHGGSIDPQTLLGNLEANATKAALRRLKTRAS